ncbi:MAG: AAA family ATPase [Deltaproteobacteria bacterium]|nr:AAA family ATPase [Deltaproteobacteria bacterium]
MTSQATRLTFYNHKGGVGKTTIAVNVGAALASKGKRVLLVDSDPQCNLTSYFFPDDFVNSLLEESETPKGRTVWSALKPLIDEGNSINIIEPFETVINDLFIIPGDIRLSEFEQSLADFWTDCFKRRIIGIKATTALSNLINKLIIKYKFDYVIYDTGPNIGPLNRVILLDCDYFIVPVACDLFSVRALSTLGQSLKRWIIDWETITDLAPDGLYLLKGKPRFLGYIPQRFKTYGQKMAEKSRFYLGHIQRQIHSDLISVLREVDSDLAAESASTSNLGQIKDFGSLVQIAQTEGVPLSKAREGADYLKLQALNAFNEIAENIIRKASISTLAKKKLFRRVKDE